MIAPTSTVKRLAPEGGFSSVQRAVSRPSLDLNCIILHNITPLTAEEAEALRQYSEVPPQRDLIGRVFTRNLSSLTMSKVALHFALHHSSSANPEAKQRLIDACSSILLTSPSLTLHHISLFLRLVLNCPECTTHCAIFSHILNHLLVRTSKTESVQSFAKVLVELFQVAWKGQIDSYLPDKESAVAALISDLNRRLKEANPRKPSYHVLKMAWVEMPYPLLLIVEHLYPEEPIDPIRLAMRSLCKHQPTPEFILCWATLESNALDEKWTRSPFTRTQLCVAFAQRQLYALKETDLCTLLHALYESHRIESKKLLPELSIEELDFIKRVLLAYAALPSILFPQKPFSLLVQFPNFSQLWPELQRCIEKNLEDSKDNELMNFLLALAQFQPSIQLPSSAYPFLIDYFKKECGSIQHNGDLNVLYLLQHHLPPEIFVSLMRCVKWPVDHFTSWNFLHGPEDACFEMWLNNKLAEGISTLWIGDTEGYSWTILAWISALIKKGIFAQKQSNAPIDQLCESLLDIPYDITDPITWNRIRLNIIETTRVLPILLSSPDKPKTWIDSLDNLVTACWFYRCYSEGIILLANLSRVNQLPQLSHFEEINRLFLALPSPCPDTVKEALQCLDRDHQLHCLSTHVLEHIKKLI